MVSRHHRPIMADERIVRTEGSRAVQGCLVGAVLLFIILLVAMIILAYQQFRENTGEPSAPQTSSAELVEPPGPASSIAHPSLSIFS